ncbi:unnamed protein product [Lactuca virosa]|uniref:Uncharacterized protein n=1 Tax=Lactuca virosa TaxID=75947 RepID=A0AAU9LSK9_9ASTR|nr:unnamed protein product [Lactuca virosa]
MEFYMSNASPSQHLGVYSTKRMWMSRSRILCFSPFVSRSLILTGFIGLLGCTFMLCSCKTSGCDRIGTPGKRKATCCGLWWVEMLKTSGQYKEEPLH